MLEILKYSLSFISVFQSQRSTVTGSISILWVTEKKGWFIMQRDSTSQKIMHLCSSSCIFLKLNRIQTSYFAVHVSGGLLEWPQYYGFPILHRLYIGCTDTCKLCLLLGLWINLQ